MGESSQELQRDVRELRADVNRVLSELNDRLAEATDLRKQIERHPYVVLGTGAVLLTGVAALTYGIWMRSHGPGGGIWPLAAFQGRPVSTHVEGRVKEMQEELQTSHRNHFRQRSEGPVKRILWAALSSAILTLATYLAHRLTESAWKQTMGELPPTR